MDWPPALAPAALLNEQKKAGFRVATESRRDICVLVELTWLIVRAGGLGPSCPQS